MTLLKIAEVAKRVGLSAMSIRRMVDRGEFVKPIQISPRRIGFDADEVAAWLANRPRGKFQYPAQFTDHDLL